MKFANFGRNLLLAKFGSERVNTSRLTEVELYLSLNQGAHIGASDFKAAKDALI